ncbi:MAG: AlpA family phage regulatory protein [Actinobacteria bacterium]|nr:AlpA family phage regulatory protein [Actinomycetota bacterium]
MELLSRADMQEMLHISRSAVWRLTKSPTFPEPLHLGSNIRWIRSEVEQWLLTNRERTAKPAACKISRHGPVDTLPEIVLVPA